MSQRKVKRHQKEPWLLACPKEEVELLNSALVLEIKSLISDPEALTRYLGE
jgi:hypothetical protein